MHVQRPITPRGYNRGIRWSDIATAIAQDARKAPQKPRTPTK